MDKDLKEYKNSIIETFNRNQEDFEKQLIFISSGSFALSMFFIEKVVPDLSASIFKSFLIISWILLGSTLIINLISHYISSRNNHELVNNINNDKYDVEKIQQQQRNLFHINQITIFTLIFGILFLISYSTINIMSKSNNEKPATENKVTSVIPPTPKPKGQNQIEKDTRKLAQIALPPVKPPKIKTS